MSFEVSESEAGRRLDVVVAQRAGVSRSGADELISSGNVAVDGRSESKSYRVKAGEVVTVGELAARRPAPVPAGAEVVFEDDHLLVVYKPAGMVVHTAPGVREGTLVDALRAGGHRLAALPDEDRPGIVHRLDRDVSGLLVVGKTDDAYQALSGAMSRREIDRRYLALVEGEPPTDTGKIDAPVGRSPKHRTRMAVGPEGRSAVTWFSVKQRFPGAALLDVRLETGRTHQIRTHLASIGLPIVGDSAYGRDTALARRLGVARPFLHAYRLAFDHPATGDRIEIERGLPSELARTLERL